MLELFIFMLVCFSISSIIVDQKIFEDVRSWINVCATEHPNWFTNKLCKFIHCYFCTGVWAGFFVSYFFINPFTAAIWAVPVGGAIGGVSSYYLNILGSMIEKYAEERFNIET